MMTGIVLANLTLPRDFSVPITIAWIVLLFWICAGMDRRLAIKRGMDPWQDQAARRVMAQWLNIDEAKIVDAPRRGLERIRNGWGIVGITIVAAGLIFVIYATNPYMWSL